MNFLYPGFLFALISVAIPVIIHLFNFRKFKKVYFSNVAFLKEVKEQTSSREKLKNLFILISRILAIVFLVFAFARPFIPHTGKIDQTKNNIISVYLDNSYSMDAVNKDGSLLDEAKRKAKEIVKSYQLNDRFQLLTNDFEGKHQRLLNADEFLQAVEEVKISAASRPLQQVLNRQQSIFNGVSNRFSYIISDFQNGFAGKETIQTDPNTNISLLKLNANDLLNVAVDSVWFLSPVHQANSTEKIVVQLRNYGDQEAENVSLKLTINNQQKAISSLNIPAGQTAIDTISYSGLKLGWQKAVVSLKDFPITFDDELNFSFNVNASQNILSINGLNAGKYIKALYSADNYFKLTEMPEANINYAAFNNYSLIVLNSINNPSTGLAQELKTYVANGGSVAIFPDLGTDTQVYSTFLTALNLPAVAELKNSTITVSAIDLKNPLFKDVFEGLPQKVDLPVVNRYFSYAENNNTNKENLLSLPVNQLFFAKYAVDDGQIYLSATALGNEVSNFSTHPVFVPLMYKIAFTSVKDQALYYTVMKENVLEHKKIDLATNQSLKLVSDGFEIIPEVRNINGKTLLYVADEVKKPGFYEIKKGDSTLSIVAFNNNKIESDMHYNSKSDLQKLFGQQSITFIDSKSDSITSGFAAKNNGTQLWKLCLILSIVFLAIEILLIRFYSTHKQTNS